MRALGAVHTTVKEVDERTTMFMVTEYWGPLISRLVVMNTGELEGPYPTVNAATVIRYVVQGSREPIMLILVVLFCCHCLPVSGSVMLMP